MRNYLFLAGIFLMASCADRPSEAPSTYVFSGKVMNSDAEFVLLFNNEKSADTLIIDENGAFGGTYELNESAAIPFRIGRNGAKIYVQPGDSLTMNVDGTDFSNSLEFKGAASQASTFMHVCNIKDEEIRKQHPASAIYTLPEEEFLGFQDSLLIARTNAMKEQSETVPQILIDERTTINQYKWAYAIQSYENSARWYQQNDSLMVSDNFKSALDAVPLENVNALDIPEYDYYVEEKVYEKIIADSIDLENLGINEYFQTQMNTMIGMFQNPEVKDHFLTSTMKQLIGYSGSEDLSEIIAFYQSSVKDEEKLAEVMEAYTSWDHLRAGEPAPGFSYKNMAGEELSLSDYIGKVVYIDVWATWCGPCLGEIPSLLELEEEMAEEDVVFVSVSVDDDQEAWRTMVTEDELGGVQLSTGSGWKSKITDDYKISGIPRFILVDREGNLVSAAAPRPSSGDEIREMIHDALNSNQELAVVN